jgi:hypothetical protein
MAHDVFVSYVRKDKLVANAVCAILEHNQIRCWIAPRDVRPGEDFGAEIINGINGSRLLVLIFSGAVNDSPHVIREVERAASKNLPILPFRIEDTVPVHSLEFYLSSTHWLDALTKPIEKHLIVLTERAAAILAVPLGEGGVKKRARSSQQWTNVRSAIVLVVILMAISLAAIDWKFGIHRILLQRPSSESIRSSRQFGARQAALLVGSMHMGKILTNEATADPDTILQVRLALEAAGLETASVKKVTVLLDNLQAVSKFDQRLAQFEEALEEVTRIAGRNDSLFGRNMSILGMEMGSLAALLNTILMIPDEQRADRKRLIVNARTLISQIHSSVQELALPTRLAGTISAFRSLDFSVQADVRRAHRQICFAAYLIWSAVDDPAVLTAPPDEVQDLADGRAMGARLVRMGFVFAPPTNKSKK